MKRYKNNQNQIGDRLENRIHRVRQSVRILEHSVNTRRFSCLRKCLARTRNVAFSVVNERWRAVSQFRTYTSTHVRLHTREHATRAPPVAAKLALSSKWSDSRTPVRPLRGIGGATERLRPCVVRSGRFAAAGRTCTPGKEESVRKLPVPSNDRHEYCSTQHRPQTHLHQNPLRRSVVNHWELGGRARNTWPIANAPLPVPSRNVHRHAVGR